MKMFNKLILMTLLAISLHSTLFSAPFTPNNLVVVRLGDGSAALSNAGTLVFLDEYTPAGVLVQSIQMPVILNGQNRRFVISGSATSEGFLILSPNRQYLTMAGYDTIPGVSSVASTAGINRVIALVNYLGSVNTTTSFIDGYVTNNVRSAVTADGNGFWVSGTGSSSTGGVRYITLGGTTSTQVSTSVVNTRVVSIFNGQLIVSASSGAFLGINKVGSGLPTGTGEVITNSINTLSGSSSYGFAYNSDTSVCYVADDRSLPNGGVQKWTRSGGVWSLAYTLNSGLTKGCRGLTVNFSGSNPVLYAVMDSTVSNKVFSVTDNGAASVFNNVITAGANQLIRGIAFSPVAPPPPVPLAPTPVSPANNSTGNLTSLILVWNKPANATNYRVQLATDSLFTNIVINDSTLTDSLRSITGLVPLTNYWWRVNAKNVSGTSAFSTAFKFRTLGVPAQITGMFVPANGASGQATTVDFRWPKAVDQTLANPVISNYWFELTTDTVSFANLTRDSLLTDTLRTSSGLSNNITYYWRVKAKNQSGWGAFSQWLRFTTSPLGLTENGGVPKEFALYSNYPNPFNPATTIRFEVPVEGIVNIKVFDLLGREISTLYNTTIKPGRYSISFDASNLSSGFYFYKMSAGSFTSVKKMILIK
jgi:hypothetical protein